MSIQTMKQSRSQSPTSTTQKRCRVEIPPASKNVRASKTVRFLILSGSHANELTSAITECDVLLHCGDLTEDGSPASIASALRALGKMKAELKLAIARNHEISMDRTYYLAEGGSPPDIEQAHLLVTPESTSEASKNGTSFLKEGMCW